MALTVCVSISIAVQMPDGLNAILANHATDDSVFELVDLLD